MRITIEDDKYPERLRRIPNPPNELYLEGNVELLKENIISIVGSRSCSQNGCQLANKFAKELAKQGIVIASGMAKGIDTSAHIGTLEAKGKTIAILGNGFNHIFPKENIKLYKEIVKQGGLIVSEYPPDTVAESSKFLERNRIVSGLSLGILVVEAAHRSGTSVTAKFATKQGRKVFVLPHEIGDKHGVGTNNLLKSSAILVTSPRDIIEKFDFLKYDEKKENNKISRIKEIIREEEQNAREDKKKLVKIKDKEHEEIYRLIEEGICTINEISRKTKKRINEISNILLMLEIEGHIKKVAGGYTCT